MELWLIYLAGLVLSPIVWGFLTGDETLSKDDVVPLFWFSTVWPIVFVICLPSLIVENILLKLFKLGASLKQRLRDKKEVVE